jgi:hypothetical protein
MNVSWVRIGQPPIEPNEGSICPSCGNAAICGALPPGANSRPATFPDRFPIPLDPERPQPPIPSSPTDPATIEERRALFRKELTRILGLGLLALMASCGVCTVVLLNA